MLSLLWTVYHRFRICENKKLMKTTPVRYRYRETFQLKLCGVS